MSSITSDGRLGARPGSPLTVAAALPRPQAPGLASGLPSHSLSSDSVSARDERAPRSSVLTASGAVSDPFSPPAGAHASSPNPSQPGPSSLYYAGHMTGSWPTPGLSQPSAYTYGGSSSTGPASGPLAPPPYSRAAAAGGPSYASTAPSPSQQHFPGRGASSASNSDSHAASQPPTPYQEQQGFASPLGVGGAAAGTGATGLGSPLNAPGSNQPSGLSHPLLAAANQAARQAASTQTTTGPGQGPAPNATAPESSAYRPPPPPGGPSSYYPQTSSPQQQQQQQQTSFPGYPSSAPPPPQSLAPVTSSAPSGLSRPSGSIPALAAAGTVPNPSPLGYSTATGPRAAAMAASPYSPYPTAGPILSNIHHPGGALTMVGGPAGPAGPSSGAAALPSYSHHHHPGHHPPGHHPPPPLGHHPGHHHPHHSLYLHHPAAPPTPPAERPFKCTENGCMQAFNRNHDLKRHQRIHLAVKPFACEDCEKRFSRKDALKRHRLVKGCGSNIHASSNSNNNTTSTKTEPGTAASTAANTDSNTGNNIVPGGSSASVKEA
ncbi:hypothetical protein VTJ04DRAFT_2522 [Mycothermus thermophilus]|uniref:uncharacterized protein n=1 Tax=Humicola insolens TaxID=85995 RepID=UPI003742A4BA